MKNIVYSFTVLFLFSCVSTKVYDKVNKEKNALSSENVLLQEENQKYKQESLEYRTRYDISLAIIDSLKRLLELERAEKEIIKNSYDILKNSYDALLKSNNNILTDNARKSRLLLEELEKKETALKEKEYSITKMLQDIKSKEELLQNKEQRINELEKLIKDKEDALNRLKDNLKSALSGFEDKGIQIETKNGKIYVLLDNKLLFKSGSYDVIGEGQKALKELGNVLEKHKDISVIIEGHTDNIPYIPQGQIQDNWDLSVFRATSVVKILLKNKNINPLQIIPSGRGELLPKVPNDTPSNRSVNRRIEIIISPDYSKIESLLNEK